MHVSDDMIHSIAGGGNSQEDHTKNTSHYLLTQSAENSFKGLCEIIRHGKKKKIIVFVGNFPKLPNSNYHYIRYPRELKNYLAHFEGH